MTKKSRFGMVFTALFGVILILQIIVLTGEDASAEEPTSKDWPMFRLDHHHTGFKEGLAPDTNDTFWIFDTYSTRWVVSSPMIVDEYVYIGSDNGKLYKLYLENGTEVWNYTAGPGMLAQFWSSPFVDKENDMVLCHASGVHAINMTTGERVWHFDTNHREFCSPVVHDCVVFVGSYDKHVYALPEFDPNGDGTISESEVIWYYKAGEYHNGNHVEGTGGAVSTTLAIVDGMVIGAEQTNYDEGNNYCDYNIFVLPEVDPDSSGVIEHDEIIWKYEIGAHVPIIDCGIPGDNGDAFSSPSVNVDLEQVYIGSRDQYMYAFALYPEDNHIDNDLDGIVDNEGELRWRYQVDNEIFSSPSIHNGNVYFGSGQYSTSASPGSVYALNETNGGLVWRYQGADGFLSSALIADGNVFIGSNDEHLYAFSEENGTILWQYKAEGGGSQNAFGSSPSLYDEKIVVGSCNGKVYCFKTPNQPPEVALFSPKKNSTVNASVILEWKGTDPNPGDLEKLRYDVYLAIDYDLVSTSHSATLVSMGQENESFQPTDLQGGKEYYWKVVVNDTELECESDIWSFFLNCKPDVELISPENGTRIISTTINLTWEGNDDDGDNLTYFIYLDNNPIPITNVFENQTTEIFEATELVVGETYYWKVVVNDGYDEGVSDIWSFRMNRKPEVRLISPEDDTKVTSTAITLSWEGDDEDEDSLRYDLYLDTHPDPSKLVTEDMTGKFYTPSHLKVGGTYYWKIAVSDGFEESISEIRSFTVNRKPEVDLISPEDGVVINMTTVTLNWKGNDEDGDDLIYDVYMDTDSTPVTRVAWNLTGESFEITGLEDSMIYYWMVAVIDGVDRVESAIRIFQIDTEYVSNHPPGVRLTTPQNGSIITRDNINLFWAGSDDDNDRLTYNVYLGTDPTAGTLVSRNQLGISYFASGLKTNSTYYWKVVASDGEDEGSSPIWQFIVEEKEDDDDDDEWYEKITDEPLYLGGIAAVMVVVVAVAAVVRMRRRGKPGEEEEEWE